MEDAEPIPTTIEPGREQRSDDRIRRPPLRADAAVDSTGGVPGVVAHSRSMKQVLATAERAACSEATVLLSGETGTGKEVVAREVHRRGPRGPEPFMAVNCAAFPDTLLESELFGYKRGAFTGANRDKPGVLDAAGRGTIFLDEVGNTSLGFQAKLLRVLQERYFLPIGDTRQRRLGARVVAAANIDLEAEVDAGRFRPDLYYRLAVLVIEIPPLRERQGDVLPLARHFLAIHGAREGKLGCRLEPEAERALLAYSWPGNVRELENRMHRLLALAEPGQMLSADALSLEGPGRVARLAERVREGETLADSMARVEALLIRAALDDHGWHRVDTARRLGLTREGLYKKMKRLNIE